MRPICKTNGSPVAELLDCATTVRSPACTVALGPMLAMVWPLMVESTTIAVIPPRKATLTPVVAPSAVDLEVALTVVGPVPVETLLAAPM